MKAAKRIWIAITLAGILVGLTACGQRFLTQPEKPIASKPSKETERQIVLGDVNRISISGDYCIDLVDTNGPTTVLLEGPADLISAVNVQTNNNKASINFDKSFERNLARKIHLVLSVNALCQLNYEGNGVLMGNQLQTDNLSLSTKGNGNIQLSGRLNLRAIQHEGGGQLKLTGVSSEGMRFATSGSGDVFLQGTIGISDFTYQGSGNIRIGKLTAQALNMLIDGSGTLELDGVINLKKLEQKGSAQLKLYWVESDRLSITVNDTAKAELAGIVKWLYLNTYNTAQCNVRYLRAENAFVLAKDNSSVKVNVSQQLYSDASDNAAIYTYGRPEHKAITENGLGTVLPM